MDSNGVPLADDPSQAVADEKRWPHVHTETLAEELAVYDRIGPAAPRRLRARVEVVIPLVGRVNLQERQARPTR